MTDNSGSFKLTAGPPGSYTLEVWHETLEEVSKKATAGRACGMNVAER